MREFDKYGYRVMVNDNDTYFLRDQLSLTILHRTPDGYRPISIEVKYGAPIPPSEVEGVAYEFENTILPRELAEILLDTLANYFIGGDEHDIIKENRRLGAELRQERVRLNKLIDGIGRLGGNNVPTENG